MPSGSKVNLRVAFITKRYSGKFINSFCVFSAVVLVATALVATALVVIVLVAVV